MSLRPVLVPLDQLFSLFMEKQAASCDPLCGVVTFEKLEIECIPDNTSLHDGNDDGKNLTLLESLLGRKLRYKNRLQLGHMESLLRDGTALIGFVRGRGKNVSFYDCRYEVIEKDDEAQQAVAKMTGNTYIALFSAASLIPLLPTEVGMETVIACSLCDGGDFCDPESELQVIGSQDDKEKIARALSPAIANLAERTAEKPSGLDSEDLLCMIGDDWTVACVPCDFVEDED